jgi:hypothetical protein
MSVYGKSARNLAILIDLVIFLWLDAETPVTLAGMIFPVSVMNGFKISISL